MTLVAQKLTKPVVVELIGLPPKVIVRCWPEGSNKSVDTEYVPLIPLEAESAETEQ